MVNVINRKAPYETGSYLVEGIGTGLKNLAEYKINQMQQQKRAQGIRTLIPDFSHEQAQSFVEQPQEFQNQFLKNKFGNNKPLVNINNGGGVGQVPFADYNKELTKKLKNVDEGLDVIGRIKEHLPKVGQALWGKRSVDLEFENDLAELERLYPEYKGLSKRIKSGTPREVIEKELAKIESNLNRPKKEQEAINAILKKTGGQVPEDYNEQIKNYLEEKELLQRASTPESEQIAAQQPQDNNGYGLSDIARVPAALAARGVQGLGEGIAGTAALPFNAANLLSGGRIPVPEAVQALERAPGEIVKGLTGELTTPKSDIEASLGEAVSDVASFLSPSGFLGAAGKGAALLGKSSKWLNTAAKVLKVPLKSAAAVSGLSNLAKFLTKKAGGNEAQQTAAKIGTLIASPLIGARFLSGEADKIANNAVKSLPAEAKVVSAPLYDKLGKAYNVLSSGEASPVKQELLNQLKSLETSNNSAAGLWKLNQTITDSLKSPELTTKAKQLLPKLSEEIGNSLGKLGSKYPEFGKQFEQYKEISNALQQSNKVGTFIQNNLSGGIERNPKLTAVFRFLGLPKYQTLATIGAPVIAAGEVERLGQMLYKSSAFRDLYGHVVNAALQGNAKEVNRLIPKLAEKIDNENIK